MSAPTKNEKLLNWVREIEAHCQPESPAENPRN